MELIALRCGDLRTDVGGLVGRRASGVVADVPIMAFAVDTGDGVVVFDTGMHEACCGPDPRAHFGRMSDVFELRCPRHALVDERLRQAGHAADEVRWVTNSHLHFDHAGRNGAFPAATQLVRARERAWAVARAGDGRGFLAGDLAAVADTPWDYDGEHELVPGVVLRDAPGHTPGHQVLDVHFDGGRRFVCIGDAAYTLAAVHDATPTGAPADAAQAVATLVSLRAAADAGATLLTAHDVDQWHDVADVATVHRA